MANAARFPPPRRPRPPAAGAQPSSVEETPITGDQSSADHAAREPDGTSHPDGQTAGVASSEAIDAANTGMEMGMEPLQSDGYPPSLHMQEYDIGEISRAADDAVLQQSNAEQQPHLAQETEAVHMYTELQQQQQRQQRQQQQQQQQQQLLHEHQEIQQHQQQTQGQAQQAVEQYYGLHDSGDLPADDTHTEIQLLEKSGVPLEGISWVEESLYRLHCIHILTETRALKSCKFQTALKFRKWSPQRFTEIFEQNLKHLDMVLARLHHSIIPFVAQHHAAGPYEYTLYTETWAI